VKSPPRNSARPSCVALVNHHSDVGVPPPRSLAAPSRDFCTSVRRVEMPVVRVLVDERVSARFGSMCGTDEVGAGEVVPEMAVNGVDEKKSSPCSFQS